MMTKEDRYILKRKVKAFGNRLCFYICRVFPVKKNRVAVCTFEGKGGFGCNPKYIVMEMHRRNPKYEFIWFVNDDTKVFPEYIKKVPNTLWRRAYWLGTSKVWLDNYRKPYGTCKRKGQVYINTWHATIGFKTIGLLRGQAFSKMAYLVSDNDSKMIDGITTDSEFCKEIFPKGLVYNGEFLHVGAPRCDILYGDRIREREIFRKKHNLPADAKVLMFAPTFREGAKDGKRYVFSEIWSIDFLRLMQTIEKKFGGEWYICLRVHPQLADGFKEYENEILKERMLNESNTDDMYEVLAAMDAYITDYSSAAFEAVFAHLPVFLYADDVDKYTNDRGSLLWNLSVNNRKCIFNNKVCTPGLDVKLPCTLATNNEELLEDIREFDEKQYKNTVDAFMKDIEQIFDGRASERVVNEIELRI